MRRPCCPQNCPQNENGRLAAQNEIDVSLYYQRVPEGGLEPPRAEAHWILNPARLPIPPLRQIVLSKGLIHEI